LHGRTESRKLRQLRVLVVGNIFFKTYSSMKNTIQLTPKAAKWVFIFNGMLYLMLGVGQLVRAETLISWWGLFGMVLVLVGPVMIIYGILLFYPAHRLVPKVQVDDLGIVIKEELYKRERLLFWNNIKEISYKSFELDFLLDNDRVEQVHLPTNAAISVEIKKIIRQFADRNHISVVGG
jgi:hypothetical protein